MGTALITRRRALAAGALPLALLVPRASFGRGIDLPPQKREVMVASADELVAALLDAQAGDHIVLNDGVDDQRSVVTAGGKAAAPLVIRSAHPLAAQLTGGIELSTADVILAGLELSGGCTVAGDRIRISHCRFSDTSGIALGVVRGSDVVIEFCAFQGCNGRGLSIGPKGKAGTVIAPHVHHNLFSDFRGESGENVHEAIQIGQFGGDAPLAIKAIVENNLFTNVNVDWR